MTGPLVPWVWLVNTYDEQAHGYPIDEIGDLRRPRYTAECGLLLAPSAVLRPGLPIGEWGCPLCLVKVGMQLRPRPPCYVNDLDRPAPTVPLDEFALASLGCGEHAGHRNGQAADR
ncbi:hypothetical protein GCM10012275_06920 [Longimycelium tulufanense]|uniref:Uncharacterized protein n=1 Tax=Longimycelium tulufanense TaxID=907463 RepID=A0A8J3C698_9PSEU|nr:hypothetical protein [Longimycelium tulufanense]GGM38576.1 hypothetical protein GCM10012275_06920 [Longimycelium tulufanense]